MTKKVADVQCPNCNAPLHFNIKLGKMKCDYCDSEFEPSALKVDPELLLEESQEIKKEIIDNTEYVIYNCPDCGAQIVADEQTSATFCLYCGNTSILKNKLTGEFKPSKLIPFKQEKQAAIEAFKALSKGRPFMPKSFNSEKNIEKITGLYVPFWLYEVGVNGGLEVKATKVKTWTTGNTHYTKTDFYDVNREGKLTFKRVPVDGSTRFDNDIMNTIEPFDYNMLVDFNPNYLSGFLAEKYDVVSDEAFKDAASRSLESSKNIMLNDMVGYTTKSIKNNNLVATKNSDEYVLLPVYMVNVKYEGKYYIFAMNGQSGEFVGNIPLNKKKVVVWYIGLFFVLFFLIYFLCYIIYLMGGL